MFSLRNIIKETSRRNLKRIWRKYTTEVANKVPQGKLNLSYREKEWLQSQEKYAKYPNIFYSSYLETLEEHMSKRRKNALEFRKSKEEVRKFPELRSHEIAGVGTNVPDNFPEHWMEDYEYYDGEKLSESIHGTCDPTLPASKVPCSGCGANLHCQNTNRPGYIPLEIFKNRTKKELQTIICQRCHFLKHYNIALDIEVTPESYVETITKIKDDFALAMIIVDLLDFPCSIWPGMQKLLGSKRPVFVIGNKVDLLPRDHDGYLEHVKKCLKDQMLQSGFDVLNLKYISLVSAKTGYGIEELITQLHKIWKYKGNVYLLGCTNVGKSSLFNILLNSDYCRPEAGDLLRKATVCPWPGTTLQMLKFPIFRPSEIRVQQRFRRLFSERGQKAAEEQLRRDQARKTGSIKYARLMGSVGRTFKSLSEESNDAFTMSSGTQPITTFNERSSIYQSAKWCYDTPGVMHPEQITNLLTPEELQQLTPHDMIRPRAFRLKPGMSIFLAGLARLDFIDCKYADNVDWIKAFLFCSPQLPVIISPTEHADEVYHQYLGSKILGIPFENSSNERLTHWPGLQCKSEELYVAGNQEEGLSGDVILSSAGWIGLHLPYASECSFKAWTPHARGIYMRTPALIPFAERLIGKRIRNSLAYNLSLPFVFKK